MFDKQVKEVMLKVLIKIILELSDEKYDQNKKINNGI